MLFDFELTSAQVESSGYSYIEELPDDFDFRTAMSSFGNLVPQYDGDYLRDITPDPAIADDALDSRSLVALPPHTEWYEFDAIPPRYVALWCIHGTRGSGGETLLADGYELLSRFSAEEVEQLHRKPYRWTSNALKNLGRSQSCMHPALRRSSDSIIVSFSTNDFAVDDDLSYNYHSRGLKFFDENCQPIKLVDNSLLIWDNWRMLHGRNGFTDRDRRLRRVLIDA